MNELDSDHDELINVLKDCWEGRIYRGGPTMETLIQVKDDYDGYFAYEVFEESELHKTSIRLKFNSTSKEGIKSYLETYGYVRVK